MYIADLKQTRTAFCKDFLINFVVQKLSYFYSNFTTICSWGSNRQYTSIASDNGLAPNSHQAIIWTNGGLSYWRDAYMCDSGNMRFDGVVNEV